MATFLDYSSTQQQKKPQASAYQPTSPAGYSSVTANTHPAVTSYLASGDPYRQGFVQQLQQGASPIVINQASQDPNPSNDPVQTAPAPNTSPLPAPTIAQQPHVSAPIQTSGFNPQGDWVDVDVGNYTADPFLQDVLAQQQAALQTGRGNTVKSYEDLLMGFGSQQLARQSLGSILGMPEYASAAGVSPVSGGQFPDTIEKLIAGISDNPDTSTTTLGQLNRASREAQRSSAYDYNSSNLFYSGARGRALRNLDYKNQLDVNTATDDLRKALSGVTGQETDLENQWASRAYSAESDAYQRALSAALGRAKRPAPAAAGGGGPPGPGQPGPDQPTWGNPYDPVTQTIPYQVYQPVLDSDYRASLEGGTGNFGVDWAGAAAAADAEQRRRQQEMLQQLGLA